ncbi:MAG: hypothetical protein J7M14_01425 [Planctomycetes bacterium]|nr:hypothetical protein [Planctomycetota bacterium]
MLRKMVLGLTCCLLTSSLAMAQVKVVKLRRGGSLTGTVRKTDGGYEVTTRLGKVEVAAGEVLLIEDAVTPEDEYLQRLEKIDRENADERYALGEWAMNRNLLRIAAVEFEAALRIDPAHEKAALLLKQVKSRQARARIGSGSSGRAKASKARRDKTQFITPKDINRMRLAELAEGEPIRSVIGKKALEDFLTSIEGSDDVRNDPDFARKFRRRRTPQQLRYILKEVSPGNWGILDGIKLKTDPKVFRVFRRQIWPLVVRNCGTPVCHGAAKGKGQLKLHTSLSDDIAVYTNFLILDMYAKEGKKLIDRGDPMRSLLLEYGLETKDAREQHPCKIKAIFRSLKDRRYRMVEKWIDSLKGPPHPDYGVTFKPPFGPPIEKFDPLEPSGKKKDKPQGPTTTQPTKKPAKKVIRPI